VNGIPGLHYVEGRMELLYLERHPRVDVREAGAATAGSGFDLLDFVHWLRVVLSIDGTVCL
jgi:hypothetical protein